MSWKGPGAGGHSRVSDRSLAAPAQADLSFKGASWPAANRGHLGHCQLLVVALLDSGQLAPGPHPVLATAPYPGSVDPLPVQPCSQFLASCVTLNPCLSLSGGFAVPPTCCT